MSEPMFDDFYDFKNEEVEQILQEINDTFFDNVLPLLQIIKLYLQDSDRLTTDELLDLRNHLISVRRFCKWYFIELHNLLEEVEDEYEEEVEQEIVYILMEEKKAKKKLCDKYNRHLDWVDNHLRVLQDMSRRRSMSRGRKP
jgi:hypothetical protein